MAALSLTPATRRGSGSSKAAQLRGVQERTGRSSPPSSVGIFNIQFSFFIIPVFPFFFDFIEASRTKNVNK